MSKTPKTRARRHAPARERAAAYVSSATTVRRYFTRVAKRNGLGGAGLIGTRNAATSGRRALRRESIV